MADSPFQSAARQRWLRYEIRGDGQYAVVCPVCRLVTLYDFALLAATEATQQHSNWQCADKHKIEHVEPAPVPQLWESRIWERD
jgi:hypothetical protein